MAGRNRMNYGRNPGSVQYQGYPYGDGARRQLGPSRDNGTGVRDASGLRRGSDLDPLLSRRMPGPSFTEVDPRVISDRNVHGGLGDGRLVSGGRGALPLPTAEPPMHTSQQIFNVGANRLPYEQGGPLGPGAMGSYLHAHPLPPMRGGGDVGAHNYTNVDNYSVLHQQQPQLSDGSLRTMYPGHELGGNQPFEAGLKGVGGFRGGYVGLEEASLALGAAHSQKLLQHGVYQGRQIGRDGRLMHVGGWEEDGLMGPPLSPRAMPMSPRRDDMMRMMSPRRDDLTPPPMSPRREDFPYMISPRREDISPLRSPRRREYPSVPDYRGRLPQRIGFSPPREEDFLLQPRVDFPMSPRRFSPPMSPRGGWDYDVMPPVSPPRVNVPMSPRRDSPIRSPAWGRSRPNAKPPSQWDVLPGNTSAWNGGSDRQSRRDSRRDYPRGGERNVGYGADIDDPNRFPSSRRGEGRFSRAGDDEELHYWSSGRSYDDHQPHRYGMANVRPNAYNSMVNQRVGLVTKYIERERAERAAKDSADKIFKDSSSSRKSPANGLRAHADSIRPSRSDRRNEKDSLEAAIAKTTANLSKLVPSSAKRSSKNEKRSTGPTPPSIKAAPAPNTDKSGAGEKASNADVAENPPAANGTAAAGSSGQSSTQEVAKDSNQETKDSKNPVPSKAGTEDATLKNSVDGNSGNSSGPPSTGPSNNLAKGNTNPDSQPGGDLQREPAFKRPSLVSEIERATKSRKLSEQHNHDREVDETYYNANELSADFITKMNKVGSRYFRMINDDPSLKRRYEGGGGQGGLHCLVCGKGSKTYSDIYELISHAQHSQVPSKRIDHMGLRKALIDVLKLDIKEPRVSNIEADEDTIVWPPVVVVENTRTGMGADRRWEGVSNSEMALLLNGYLELQRVRRNTIEWTSFLAAELGHLHGRAKSIWDKFGHRGIVHVEFEPTLEGLQEAERLHYYFLQNGRGRVQWDIIRPFKTGLPGFDTVPEGPDFTRFDEVTKTTRRVLYGYLALRKDVDKIFSKKQRKKVQVTNRKEVKAKLLARPAGEQLVI